MMRHTDAGWSNPKVLTIVAVIFLCGAAVGTAVTRQYLHSKMFPARVPVELAPHVNLKTLKAKLSLTPDQEKIVTKELDDYVKYYQNIEEQREDVAEHGKQRILDVLDDQQKKRFLAMFNHRAAR
ncbi:MAG: hypothetical protein ACJ74Z_11895 [Bryobacteraceae bacterium]